MQNFRETVNLEERRLTTQCGCTLKKANVFTDLFKLIFLPHPDNHDNEGFILLIKLELTFARWIQCDLVLHVYSQNKMLVTHPYMETSPNPFHAFWFLHHWDFLKLFFIFYLQFHISVLSTGILEHSCICNFLTLLLMLFFLHFRSSNHSTIATCDSLHIFNYFIKLTLFLEESGQVHVFPTQRLPSLQSGGWWCIDSRTPWQPCLSNPIHLLQLPCSGPAPLPFVGEKMSAEVKQGPTGKCRTTMEKIHLFPLLLSVTLQEWGTQPCLWCWRGGHRPQTY